MFDVVRGEVGSGSRPAMLRQVLIRPIRQLVELALAAVITPKKTFGHMYTH